MKGSGFRLTVDKDQKKSTGDLTPLDPFTKSGDTKEATRLGVVQSSVFLKDANP